MRDALIQISYIAAAVLFIFGLKMLNSPATARRGNLISAVGMLLAIVATLAYRGLSYHWIVLGIVAGSVAGLWSAKRVPMTAMPEFVALFNGFGGLASLLIGWAEYDHSINLWRGLITDPGFSKHLESPIWFKATAIYVTVLIGGVTFSGSIVAYGKLAERISGKPYLFKGQQAVNALVLAVLVIGMGVFFLNPTELYPVFLVALVLSLALGVLLTIPIGGADMPVVLSLLNSYSGLAACAAGFVILNTVLIVAGALVGASGIILTTIMCKAMNRSLSNVLFGGFGSNAASGAAEEAGEAKAISADDAYYALEAANNVIIVPGYGMAVAQAQHAVRELGDLLEDNGTEVRYAIHPVAGRMPGHMNVLLAEANVPYEQLVEMDDINPLMETVDVAIVIGANDVVNPAAREDAGSAIYGMPIINVDKARTVFVLKRSMRSGFAGIENPLFYRPNTRMLFGDAKASVQALVTQFKGG
ncbi:MAG: NAD(P)(+) transhydrogenase (Re/Si-specific) subunit beta [FCB group bacterium]|jgi:NAD(P) transhydrogenase subunit beta|nr:NAD(P)(+) transhydrogenase (Re/Si-specific) subunit beta [FCB group bacterium]